MRAEFGKLRSAADYERLITEQVPRVPREWRRPMVCGLTVLRCAVCAFTQCPRLCAPQP